MMTVGSLILGGFLKNYVHGIITGIGVICMIMFELNLEGIIIGVTANRFARIGSKLDEGATVGPIYPSGVG